MRQLRHIEFPRCLFPSEDTITSIELPSFCDASEEAYAAVGLLRLGRRIKRCRLPYDRVHPVILSGSHPLSQKLTMAFHEKLRHAGTDFVLSHIRHHYWMTGGREEFEFEFDQRFKNSFSRKNSPMTRHKVIHMWSRGKKPTIISGIIKIKICATK